VRQGKATKQQWHGSTKFPIVKVSGEKFLAGVSFDITERKQAEAALKEQAMAELLVYAKSIGISCE
jgi:hypothetical protein